MKRNAIFDILIGVSLILALFLDLHIGLLFTCILFFIRGITGMPKKSKKSKANPDIADAEQIK